MKQPESMAKRIRRAIVLVGVICVTLTALGTAVLFQRAFGHQLTGTCSARRQPSPPDMRQGRGILWTATWTRGTPCV